MARTKHAHSKQMTPFSEPKRKAAQPLASKNKKQKKLAPPTHAPPAAGTGPELHPWLQFEEPDFEKRYRAIKDLPIMPSSTFDWETMEDLGIKEKVTSLLQPGAWLNFFEINEPQYVELTQEFYSTFKMQKEIKDFHLSGTITFRLGGKDRSCSVATWATRLKLCDANETHDDTFIKGVYKWKQADTLPQHYWAQHATGEYNTSQQKSSQLHDPVLRIVHRALAHSISPRMKSTGNVSEKDLLYLYCMLEKDHPCQVAYCLARFFRDKTGNKVPGSLCGGPYITRLARSFNIITSSAVKAMETGPAMKYLDMFTLYQSFMVCQEKDNWVLVPWGGRVQGSTLLVHEGPPPPKHRDRVSNLTSGTSTVATPVTTQPDVPSCPSCPDHEKITELQTAVSGLREDVNTILEQQTTILQTQTQLLQILARLEVKLQSSTTSTFSGQRQPIVEDTTPTGATSPLQDPAPPISWPAGGVLTLDWVKTLMSTLDWASKNFLPSELPTVLSKKVIEALVLTASEILHQEANCVVVEAENVVGSCVVVVGDVHGQLHDLLFLLKDAGYPDEQRFYVFNGDYIDRGAWGVETFLILLAWKVLLPHRVFLLRGNHETEYCTMMYGFKNEVLAKYGGDDGEQVYRNCKNCFKELPLASIIAGSVFTSHGGIFRKISKRKKKRKVSLSIGYLKDLLKANRRVLDPSVNGQNLIAGDVLWSDPKMEDGLSPNAIRRIGLLWGPDCTEDFLKTSGLKLIIRSHEGPDARVGRDGFRGMDEGYTIDHIVPSGKLITVFSAPDYPQFQAATEVRYNNKGAYIVLESPNFDTPVFHSFDAVTPRPAAEPYYEYESVPDSDAEIDVAKGEDVHL